MRSSTLEGAAFCLILGLGACADGLAEAPGGMAVLVGGVAVSALLVHLAHSRAWERERTEAREAGQIGQRGRIWQTGTGQAAARKGKQRGQLVPLRTDKQRLVQGKKKAAEVVATPQRRVKQSSKANISRPILPGQKEIVNLDFKMIEVLLLASNGYTGTLDGNFLHLKEPQDSEDNFFSELEKLGIRRAELPESLDEALVTVESEYERQGFISGFRMGARLMLECIGPAPLESWDPNDIGNPVSRVK